MSAISLQEMARLRVKAISDNDRLRVLGSYERHDGVHISHTGETYINFSTNDYLGLATHPQMIEAAVNATKRFGVGSGASRYVTGNHPLYTQLEARIAAYKRHESSLVFSSGYAANIAVIPALMGKGDVILADKLSHACMIDGAKLSGARLVRFKHNDVADLEAKLINAKATARNVLVLTETIFSMDGDRAPLGDISDVCKTHDAWLMTDDAHGFGVWLDQPKVGDICMGTLSKAAGSFGGYVAASHDVIECIKQTARPLIFSTALPPSVLAASLEALSYISELSSSKSVENSNSFCEIIGIKPTESAIVPLHVGSEADALLASQKLKDKGFWVNAIRPPTVPVGTSRLRFTFSALHTPTMVQALSKALKELGIVAPT